MPDAAAWSKTQMPSNCSRLQPVCRRSASSATRAPAEQPSASPVRYARHQSSAREFLRYRSRAESRASGRSSLLELPCFSADVLLRNVCLRQSNSQLSNTGNHSHALCHRNCPARIEQIKEMRALQAQLVRSQQGGPLFRIDRCILVDQQRIELVDECLRFALIHLKMLPGLRHVGFLEVAHRHLQFILIPY